MPATFKSVSVALLFLLIAVPANAATVVFQAGLIDNFAAPADPAIPDPQVLSVMGDPAHQDFDLIPGIDGDYDTKVMHTFTSLPDDIIGGSLEVSVKAGTQDAVQYSLSTDNITLLTFDRTNTSDFAVFGRRFGPYEVGDCGSTDQTPDPGLLQSTKWSPGDFSIFTLDLSELPLVDGGTMNIIPFINQFGFLNVDVDDETGVDYMLLTLETAPIPIPGAIWLLGSGLVGLAAIRKKLKK
jgi:hypothetical protein